MSSIDRSKTRRRGIRMAMQVASLSGAAAAAVMAASSTDARADATQENGTNAGENARDDGRAREDHDAFEALRVHGLSRFSCMSRGPAAPPEEPSDFEDLVARLSS